jgi:hypothetical protein
MADRVALDRAEAAVADEMEPIADGEEMVPGLYAEVAVRAYLEALVEQLPEEAEKAALDAYFYATHGRVPARAEMRASLIAFLSALGGGR